MTSQRLLIIMGILISAVVSFSIGFIVGPDTIEQINEIINVQEIDYDVDCQVSPNECAFYEVLEFLNAEHFKQPDRETLFGGAIDGAIDVLDDPYTTYFDAEESAQFAQSLGEYYVGIGVEVSFIDERIIINRVFNNSPAEGAGVHENDIITHVNNVNVESQGFNDVIGQILGDVDTEVIVGVYRPSLNETIHFTMTRKKIDNPTVEYQLITEGIDKIGYIIVNSFGSDTTLLFRDAVSDLETQGMDSLVIDLRNNGGGYLGTVYYMMTEFLINDGVPMFSTQTYSQGTVDEDEYFSSNYVETTYDIAVIVNGGSASASEVFASGMQEQGGYTIVGTQTFGKGTMQNNMDITSLDENNLTITELVGDELHISIGKWITADGNWVHYDGGSDGVTPDIIVERSIQESAYKTTLLNDEVIVFDTVDSRTANIQVILNMMGYTVRTDGYFDTITKLAIEDIQANNTLTVDGIINDHVTFVINEFLGEYSNNLENDTQLQAAINHLIND